MNDSETFDDDELSVSMDTEVEKLASQFRTELFAGNSPIAEDFLQSVSGQRREELQEKCTAIVREADDIASLHDKYEIESEAGRGAMGTVFKARHRALNMPVAVKVLHPGLSSDRFLREARLLASINSPCVVKIHDIDVLANGHPLICMEWIEGEDLAGTMKYAGGRINEPQAVKWMLQTAEGLNAAAELGITHRDFKPSNVMIDAQSNARVADFGLAFSPDEILDASQSVGIMGTPYYMAPEQAEDPRSADTRSDIYSFGAAFYHVLTGRVPFEGDSIFNVLFKHKTEPLQSPLDFCRNLSRNVVLILERCLAKSPNDRFQSFKDLADCLKQLTNPLFRLDDLSAALPEHLLHQYQQKREAYLACDFSADNYLFTSGRSLEIVKGNIVDQQVEVIVNSVDSSLSMGGATASSIISAAGFELGEEARSFAPLMPGRVLVTRAGKLPHRFIFHAVTLGYDLDRPHPTSRDIIAELVSCCFYHADSFSVESIAFPLLGTGAARFDRDVCLDTMFRTVARKLQHGLTKVQEARIIVFPLFDTSIRPH